MKETMIHENYMQMAHMYARFSRARQARKRVGALMVTPTGVILGGCNGLAPGGSNVLEEEGGRYHEDHVIHAELNCVLKAAREGVSTVGSTIYVTKSPCRRCAEMLVAAGVVRVYYAVPYKDGTGIPALESMGVHIERLEVPTETPVD